MSDSNPDSKLDSGNRGNHRELWERLLTELDDKLQLGLLDRLKRVAAYHFETEILFIDPASPDDLAYLNRNSTLQQLEILAQEVTKVREVKICTEGNFPKEK